MTLQFNTSAKAVIHSATLDSLRTDLGNGCELLLCFSRVGAVADGLNSMRWKRLGARKLCGRAVLSGVFRCLSSAHAGYFICAEGWIDEDLGGGALWCSNLGVALAG